MPAPPSLRELRVDRVPRVETRPRTLALLALSAEWSVRAERTLGGAVLVERVELAPLTGAPASLWPQFEQ
jgi:hypothetical protein